MLMKALFALAAVLATAAPLAASSSSYSTAQEVYDSLPQEEKELFLAYELAKALSLYQTTEKSLIIRALYAEISQPMLIDGVSVNQTLIEKFESLALPSDFSSNLYLWYQSESNLTDGALKTMATYGTYCTSSGSCYSFQSPFGNCCPW